MSNYAASGKLKLMTLTQRRSAKGTEYLTGVLGNVSVVAFKGKATEWGETWDLFLSERQQKPPQASGQQSGERHPSRRSQAAVDLFQRPLDRR
jgi:hypothetical protein